MRREIPFHLEELKLIDLKITNMNLMVDLIEQMQRKCQVNNLCLVNVKLNERHIDLLIEFIKASKSLLHLDLSWCEVRQASFARLLQALAENK